MEFVWDFDFSDKNLEEISKLLENESYNFNLNDNPPQYSLKEYLGHNIKVLVFEKKLMIQGGGLNNPNELVKEIFININGLRFLALQDKYKESFLRFIPKKSGLRCLKCNSSSIFLELYIEEDNPKFKYNTCGCEAAVNIYFINAMYNRIIPDFSVIFSDSLIRLFQLGFFKDYVLIFPEFIFDVCDKKLIGKKRRSKLDEFISKCIELSNKDFIKLITFKENTIIKFSQIDSSNFNEIEDKIMLELSNITNSLLVTTDNNLHNRASINNIPHIFIPGNIESKLKFLTTK